MGIVLPGVNFLITERTNQTYGQLLEKAVLLSLEIIILVMEKDSIVSDFWRPLYQVLIPYFDSNIIFIMFYLMYQYQICGYARAF